MYFIAKVKLIFEDTETGKIKKQTEQYLVEAETCTEAEAKVVKDFEGSVIEFEVSGVNESKIVKVLS